MNIRLKKNIIITSLLLSFMYACMSPEAPKVSNVRTNYCLEENFKSKIEIEQPEIQVVTEGIHLTGSVDANPDNVVHFVSLVGGIISNTYFTLGDNVKKGQVLAELRSAELSELQSQSKMIESQIKVIEKKLEATKSMYDDKISSQKDLMEVESELEVLKAEKERIESNLILFSASREKGVFQIKAPTSGIITSKSIAAGTQISSGGDVMFTISDLSEVWVMVNVYASNVIHINPGMDVNIRTLSYPGEVFKGKIARVSQLLDAEAKVLKARVVLKNEDFKLKPGMLVDVIALKKSEQEAVSISTKSMVFDDNKNHVVVYNDDCNLEIRDIEVLTKNNGRTYIASGLTENDKIISKNQLLIYEQVKNNQ